MDGVVPCNERAGDEVRAVLNYLHKVSGKAVITGQHTQTVEQKELKHIQAVTGKEPALIGFELLSYSPNIRYDDCDEECLKEVRENKNTLSQAFFYAERKALITFTWHWFSPIGGRDKSFYSENTDFDAGKAVIEGTPEHKALLNDMDVMAGYLKEFCDRRIPILWRPFHEADGTWFWWGAKGCEVAAKLYRLMYTHFTEVHDLHNLIWVWNSPILIGYPGDDVVDVISRDLYPEAHQHGSLKREYEELCRITTVDKVVAVAEIGSMPDIEKIVEEGVPWAYYMTWSNEFGSSEKFTKNEVLRENYASAYAVTLDCLPELY